MKNISKKRQISLPLLLFLLLLTKIKNNPIEYKESKLKKSYPNLVVN